LKGSEGEGTGKLEKGQSVEAGVSEEVKEEYP